MCWVRIVFFGLDGKAIAIYGSAWIDCFKTDVDVMEEGMKGLSPKWFEDYKAIVKIHRCEENKTDYLDYLPPSFW